jgi:hypothetical protein
MRRRIPVIVALLVASLILIVGDTFIRFHEALAAYLAPAPHTCGGG